MKENQRIALTRRLLRDALLQLLREKPLEKISVSALCRTAGINRTTFYHHYQTPNDVLIAMENEIVEEIRQYSAPVHSVQPAMQLGCDICNCLYRHADTLRVLFRCNIDAHLSTIISGMNQSLLMLQETQPDTIALDADSLRLTATFLGSGGYYLIRQWLLEEINKTPEEIAALLLGIISK